MFTNRSSQLAYMSYGRGTGRGRGKRPLSSPGSPGLLPPFKQNRNEPTPPKDGQSLDHTFETRRRVLPKAPSQQKISKFMVSNVKGDLQLSMIVQKDSNDT